MKRIIYYLLVFVTLFALVGSVSVFAEEVEETTTEEVTETVEPTIFTRLYEAFEEHKSDVFTLGSGAILFLISIFLRKDMSVSSKVIVDGITKVIAKGDLTDEQQKAIVGGLNEMVDGYNDIKLQSSIVKERIDEFAEEMKQLTSSNEDLDAKLENFFNVIVALIDKEILQNATVMDVLSSVYVNNNALPKGIKDYVSLKHTENAKLVHEAAILEHKTEGGTTNE